MGGLSGWLSPKGPKGWEEWGVTPVSPLPPSHCSPPVALGFISLGGWHMETAQGSKPQVAEQPRRQQITGWVGQQHWEDVVIRKSLQRKLQTVKPA